MAKKDNLSEKEKQKIKDDYNALYENSVMDVLKYSGKRELQSIADGFMPVSPEAKDKARAKRSLEFSIDDEKIMNLVQTLKSKLNNIPAELREDAAKQMTRENTSPENYLPFYNLITQQGDYGPEGNKSISLGREIGSQKTLPVSKNMGGLVGYAQGGNMSIQQQTQNVANQGRYGDSMLLHVNPAEVKGLAQAMPITVNPETGQPEAFLPFLAPILGSMAGGALLTAGGAAGLALSPALAAGIGAGLATYAQTGGSGSKALLSGLTAGFGTSAMNTAAPAATASAAPVGASITPPPSTFVSSLPSSAAGTTTNPAFTQTLANAGTQATAPSNFFDAGKRMFTQGPEGAFNFDAGAKSLANAAMTPSGMMAGTALGGRSIINSQELFEQQMRQMEMDEDQRKRDMYANNPEIQLYSASGGMTQFNRGGDTDNYGSESYKQVYAPAKQQYAVNPDFMAGFAPETMYFRPDTLNAPSVSTRGGSRPTLGADTYTGTKGGYDYEGTVDADGNYVPGTAQGVQFAPQTSIDPYAAFTGSAPQGLVQYAYNPYPVQPISMSPINDTEDTSDYTDAGGIGEDGNEGDGNVRGGDGGDGTNVSTYGGLSVGPVVGGTTNTGLTAQDLVDDYLESQGTTTDILTGGDPELLDYINTTNIGYDSSLDMGADVSIADAMGGNDMGMGGNAQINPLTIRPFSQLPFRPQDVPLMETPIDLMPTIQDIPFVQDIPLTQDIPFVQETPINFMPSNNTFMNSFNPRTDSFSQAPKGFEAMKIESLPNKRGRAAGGDTLPNKGLEALNKVAPDAVANMGYQEGGVSDFRQDPITQQVIAFLIGDSDNTEIVDMFVDKYGNETFMALREMVLNPDGTKQTEGLITGVGNSGMADDLLGSIGNKEKIAVSQDEFIVPADVVSGLGDGSSDAGSKELYSMMDRVRKKRTGTTKQPAMLANAGGLLPA